MLYIACSAGIGILLFLCLYLGFRTGLRMGMLASRGQPPAKINPVAAIKQATQDKKEEEQKIGVAKDMTKGFINMLNYTGEPKQGVQ